MAFDLKKFFADVFKPQKGEVVTVMYDVPHGEIADRPAWQERRKMAEEWRNTLDRLSGTWGVKVNPLVAYDATGGNNADLPPTGKMEGKDIKLEDVINSSTIILAMPQFSATAPLYGFARKSKKLRVGSMPGVVKAMESTGLSANYAKVSETCKMLAPIFEKAVGAEVEFSTGHKCYFDISNAKKAHTDDGILHPEKAGGDGSLSNLPAGEVYVVPNESPTSKTAGELPEKRFGQVIAYVVKANRIVDIKGTGPEVEKLRGEFKNERAWQNIAEFAIGCNDKATVIGAILQDEKAGFHWAYGRSDHLGGTVGTKEFSSPSRVVHQDQVYAKNSPISCRRLDMIFPDGKKKTLITDGDLML